MKICSASLIIMEMQIKTIRDVTSYLLEWLPTKRLEMTMLLRIWTKGKFFALLVGP